MNSIIINGEKSQQFNEAINQPARSLNDLIEILRDQISSESALITGISVDGVEIDEKLEQEWAQHQIGQFQQIDIVTKHPREIANDSLQILIEFIPSMKELSQYLADKVGAPEFDQNFIKLIDGLEMLSETIGASRKILKIGIHPEADLLEADMSSILRDLLEARKKNQLTFIQDLLRQYLPQNLTEWETRGVPGLIRSRDS